MAIIREPESLKQANQRAVVLDFGDISARAAQLRELAEREANAVLVRAHTQREKLLESAAQQGHASGYKAGFEAGRAAGLEEGRRHAIEEGINDITHLVNSLQQTLDQFVAIREELTARSQSEVFTIAVELAQRIIGRTIESRPESVVTLLEQALPLVLRTSRLRIVVHPSDAACMKEALPGLHQRFALAAHMEVEISPDVARGTCKVINDRGASIDTSVSMQLSRIAQELCCKAPQSVDAEGQTAMPLEDIPGTNVSTEEA